MCDIFLARSVGYYVSQVYIPALLIVVISWVPFWLDPHDHLARVTLGVTTVLTMTTLNTNVSSDFPKISYLKAIDIYLFTCFLLVFLSLIEYAIVGYYEHEIVNNGKEVIRDRCFKCKRQNKRKMANLVNFCLTDNSNDNEDDDEINATTNTTKQPQQLQEQQHHKQSQKQQQTTTTRILMIFQDSSVIDRWSRWIFPCTFLIFNIVYVIILGLLVAINRSNQSIEVKLET